MFNSSTLCVFLFLYSLKLAFMVQALFNDCMLKNAHIENILEKPMYLVNFKIISNTCLFLYKLYTQ